MKQVFEKYRPKRRAQWIALGVVCLVGSVMTWWVWDDLKVVAEHWRITVCGCVVLATMWLAQLGKHQQEQRLNLTQQNNVLKKLEHAPHGLTRVELATALNHSNLEELDAVVSSLLENGQLVWSERFNGEAALQAI